MPAQQTYLLAGYSLQAVGCDLHLFFHNGKNSSHCKRGHWRPCSFLQPASPLLLRIQLARVVLPKAFLVRSQCSYPRNFFPVNLKKHVLYSKRIASSEQLSSFYFRDSVGHVFFFGLAARKLRNKQVIF